MYVWEQAGGPPSPVVTSGKFSVNADVFRDWQVIPFHSSHEFTKCGDFRETGVKSGLNLENFLNFPECIDFAEG